MNNSIAKLSNDKGVTVIIVALLLAVFLGIAALAVDVGYLYMAKNQLQNVVDAAALAGARQLGYDKGSTINVKQTAKDISSDSANKVGQKIVILADDDIAIGTWAWIPKTFDTASPTPNAVRVNATMPVDTFFGRIIGNDTVSVSAESTAALTSATGGISNAPFVLSKAWFDGGCPTDELILNSNTPASCIAWNGKNKNFVDFDCIYDGGCPVYDVGEELPQINKGTIDKIFETGECTNPQNKNTIYCLWDAMRTKNDGDFDLDESDDSWTTSVVLVDESCTFVKNKVNVAGFATVKITGVGGGATGGKNLNIDPVCNYYTEYPGGGTIEGGNLSSFPKLVK